MQNKTHKAFFKTVYKLNNIKSLNKKFIYYYNPDLNWFTIYHNAEKEIQTNDEIAQQIVDILYENLIKYKIYNFSFYEDDKMLLF